MITTSMARPAAALAVLAAAVALAACGDDDSSSTAATSTTAAGECQDVQAPPAKNDKFKQPEQVLCDDVNGWFVVRLR